MSVEDKLLMFQSFLCDQFFFFFGEMVMGNKGKAKQGGS